MVKYVKDFEHPEGFGFTGSAGRVIVKGYSRGGPTKAGRVPSVPRGNAPTAPAPAAAPPVPAAGAGATPLGALARAQPRK